jgi:hypothetical protein
MLLGDKNGSWLVSSRGQATPILLFTTTTPRYRCAGVAGRRGCYEPTMSRVGQKGGGLS